MNIQDSVILLTSKDSSNDHFGSGFVIHQDTEYTYILTCSHVINDIGGPQSVKIEDSTVDVLALSNDGSWPDLALLRAAGLKHKIALELDIEGTQSYSVVICGFQIFNRLYLIRPVPGKLGDVIGLEYKGSNLRVSAWDINIDEGHSLEKGFSGSPVVDAETGRVIGVMTHRIGSSKGVAIEIKAVGLLNLDQIGEFGQNLKQSVAVNRGHNFSKHYEDWGQAPEVSSFIGREIEVGQLNKWIIQDGCRLINIVGLGGIGKTLLASKVARMVAVDFDATYWYSLRDAPLPREVITECCAFLSKRNMPSKISDLNKLLPILISLLKEKRCLIILDNFESVLQPDKAGQFLPGYEAFGQLLYMVGQSEHESCIIVTSRESPEELKKLERETSPIRSIEVLAIKPDEGKQLLHGKGLTGNDEEWRHLIDHYSGNPLILNIVSEIIREVYYGQLSDFIKEGLPASEDAYDVITSQFNRLSELECSIMYWLAIEREPLTRDDLQADLYEYPIKSEMLSAINSLRRRSLIVVTARGFTLQNVVMDCIIARLVKIVADEISDNNFRLFNSLALLSSHSKQYLRDCQTRLIINPIVSIVEARLGSREQAAQKLLQNIDKYRTEGKLNRGYAGGNALNLLISMGRDLSGLDFSGIAIWRAVLQNVNLHSVRFVGSDLSKSVFREPFGSILGVDMCSDRQLLAIGTTNGEVLVWNYINNVLLFANKTHSDWVPAIAISREKALVASGSNDKVIKVWNDETGDLAQVLRGHEKAVRCILFIESSEQLVSGSDDKTIRIWDIISGNCVKLLIGHERSVRSICFDKRRRSLISSSEDRSIIVWDYASGEAKSRFEGHLASVTSIDTNIDDTLLVSGSEDGTIRIWDLDSGKCLSLIESQTDKIRSVIFINSNLVASGGDDGHIKIWDIHSKDIVRIINAHSNWIRSLAVTDGGNILASGGEDQNVMLWDVESGNCLQALRGYKNPLWFIAYSPDNQFIAGGSENGTIQIWNTNTGAENCSLIGHSGRVWSVAFHPYDAQLLASASSDGTVRLWDIKKREAIKILRGHNGRVWSVIFNRKGDMLATGGEDSTVRIWDYQNGNCKSVLEGHTGPVRPTAFHPNNKLLISCSEDQTLRLWDVTNGECINVLRGHENWVRSVVFNSTGDFIISGSDDHTIRVWDINNGSCVAILKGHDGQVRPMASHPTESNIFASGGVDGTVRLWNIEKSECIRILEAQLSWIWSVAFSSDGTYIAASGDNGYLSIWDLKTFKNVRLIKGLTPYDKMDITGAQGLSDAQISSLVALGAFRS